MDWNVKAPLLWDWDSPGPFTGGGCGGCASSGSELGHGSSSKSSISASIDSSFMAGKEPLGFQIEAIPKNQEKHKLQGATSFPVLAAANGPKETAIRLRLGKRTYFEDAAAESNVKYVLPQSASFAVSAAAAVKKSRASHHNLQSMCCQVEGCNDDLSTAKDYHRKHRVCESHSKCARVIVAGQERRFCQQCSRFHALSEFDQKKRSCRRRLSDHNARRRKPLPEIISFDSACFSSSIYADNRQTDFLWNKAPFGHARSNANSTWPSSYEFKLPFEKGPWLNSMKTGSFGGILHLPNTHLSDGFAAHNNDIDGSLPLKGMSGITSEALNQGSEASLMASDLNGAPNLRRALSLLSTGSWVSPEPGQTSTLAQVVDTNNTSVSQSIMQSVNSTSNYWQEAKSLAKQARVFPFPVQSNGNQLHEFQLH